MIRLIFPLAVICLIVWATFFMLSKRERKQDLTMAGRWMLSLAVAGGILLFVSAIFYLGSFAHG